VISVLLRIAVALEKIAQNTDNSHQYTEAEEYDPGVVDFEESGYRPEIPTVRYRTYL
jgi:hypothetical protein